MTSQTKIKIGYSLCILGLAVAFLTLIPAIVPINVLPWPIFVGSMIYLPGSFLIFFTAQGQDRNAAFNKIRMIRLGFLAVVVILTVRIMQT